MAMFDCAWPMFTCLLIFWQEEKKKVVNVKWSKCAHKLEQILQHNGTSVTDNNSTANVSNEAVVFLVGNTLSYIDILAAHLLTWAMEELGEFALEVVRTTPLLVDLQRHVLSLPQMEAFIRSDLYYPLGDEAYVKEVSTTLGREIK